MSNLTPSPSISEGPSATRCLGGVENPAIGPEGVSLGPAEGGGTGGVHEGDGLLEQNTTGAGPGSSESPGTPPPSERRLRRSTDPYVALHYQLASSRLEGCFEALVLAEENGRVMAGAGPWPVCEELAAYAPLFVEHGDSEPWGRVASLRAGADVLRIPTHSGDIYLCGLGGKKGSPVLARTAEGVHRILGPGRDPGPSGERGRSGSVDALPHGREFDVV